MIIFFLLYWFVFGQTIKDKCFTKHIYKIMHLKLEFVRSGLDTLSLRILEVELFQTFYCNIKYKRQSSLFKIWTRSSYYNVWLIKTNVNFGGILKLVLSVIIKLVNITP